MTNVQNFYISNFNWEFQFANFIFGNPKEVNWKPKFEVGNIEVLDITQKKIGEI